MPNPRKEIRITFSQEEAAALEEAAKEQGVTPATLLRDAYRNSNPSSSQLASQILEAMSSQIAASVHAALCEPMQAIDERLAQIEESLEILLEQEQSSEMVHSFNGSSNEAPLHMASTLSEKSLQSISQIIEQHLADPASRISHIHSHCSGEFLRWYVMKAEVETLYAVLVKIGLMLAPTQEQYDSLHNLTVLANLRRENFDTTIPSIPDVLLLLAEQDLPI